MSEPSFERIAPAALAVPDAETSPGQGPKGPRLPVAWIIALVLLLVVAVLVIAVLPGTVDRAEVAAAPAVSPPAGGNAANPAQAVPAPETLSPFEEARLARLRKTAQDTLAAMVERQYLLEDQQVQGWAADDFAAAMQFARDGDTLFLARDYPGATAIYQQGVVALDAVVAQGVALTATWLDQGEAALESGQADLAADMFQRVLQIEPDDSAAVLGLARAGTLDQVLALAATAQRQERQQQLADALASWQQALALDAIFQPAIAGVSRVQEALTLARYRQAMTEGLVALEAARFDVARQAFQRAAKILPSAQESATALAQLEQDALLARIGALDSKAEAAVAREDWPAAVAAWESALALDPDLHFPGLRLARARMELGQQLQAALAAPQQLSDQTTFAAATQLYARAVKVPNPGPVLAQQLDAFERMLQVAAVPVQVQLRSDNATRVSVLRVAELGTFAEQNLPLRPGRYTLVGVRRGYRDVRKTIDVSVDMAPVTVICQEPI